jgi:Ca-activated chloride channel homolog
MAVTNASSRKLADVTGLSEQSSDPDAGPSILKRPAAETGGEAYFPKPTGNTREICDHIAHDIRTQYMIGFVSNSQKQGGAYRSVRLVAEAPGAGNLRVRTRNGYILWKGARLER